MYIHKKRCNLKVVVDPRPVHRNSGVDSGILWLSAASSPGVDSDEDVANHQWSSGVSLTGVHSSNTDTTCAQHVCGNHVESGVGRYALILVYR